MPRPPAAQLKALNETTRIEFNPVTGTYYAVNPMLPDKRIAICGFLKSDGTRCKEPLDNKSCGHENNLMVVTEGPSDNIFSILKAFSSENEEFNECLNLAENLDDVQIKSMENEIRLGYTLLFNFLKQKMQIVEENGEKKLPKLNKADIQLTLKLLREISKLKELNVRMNQVSPLDTAATTEFVKEILSTLKSVLNKEEYQKALQAIYDRVILPRQAARVLNTKGRPTEITSFTEVSNDR